MFEKFAPFERDFIVEIRTRVSAGQPVSDLEKQTVLDIIRRAGVTIDNEVVVRAAKKGFDVDGIKSI